MRSRSGKQPIQIAELSRLNSVALLRSFWVDIRSAASSKSEFGLSVAERATDRNRRAALSGITAASARIVHIGASLITVPLAIRYLGNERFGLWMTISSFLLMAGFTDFGLGNGLLNLVARASGKDDLGGIKRAISSALASLSVISLLLLFLFFAIYKYVPWPDFFRVTSMKARSEAGPALIVFVVCFALSLPAGVVQKAQMGLQRGFLANIWQLAGSVIGLLWLITCIWLRAGLPALVFAAAGAPLIAAVLNGFFFFGQNRPDLRPQYSLVSSHTIEQLISVGVLFFVLQLMVAMAYCADNFVVARTLGAVNVPEYAIPQRLFSMITMMIGMLISPLWPAYGEAISRGDLPWVKRSLVRSLRLVLVVSIIASTLCLLASHQLIYWWVGSKIHPPVFLLIGLAVWTIMECCGNALSVFMNGSGLVHFQIVVACIFGVSCIVAKVYLTRRFGVVGLPWATITTWGVIVLLPSLLYVHAKLRQMPQ